MAGVKDNNRVWTHVDMFTALFSHNINCRGVSRRETFSRPSNIYIYINGLSLFSLFLLFSLLSLLSSLSSLFSLGESLLFLFYYPPYHVYMHAYLKVRARKRLKRKHNLIFSRPCSTMSGNTTISSTIYIYTYIWRQAQGEITEQEHTLTSVLAHDSASMFCLVLFPVPFIFMNIFDGRCKGK